tara:strand:+ start:68 stop:850 length:783 start_codon:yes stop_codon:yes gene_type:complete
MTYPDIDPIAISLGPLAIHWYGLMYLVAFAAGGLLGRYRAGRMPGQWTNTEIWDLVFYIAVGAVLGGRLGYALFYNAGYYLSHPLEILWVWTGGMSFHGGLIGVVLAVVLFARRSQRRFFEVADFLAPLCAPGLLAGRIGNFINQELWGRVSDVPWAMVFPAGGPLPRHPSQLYEAALEGVMLFVIVWIFAAKTRRPGQVSGLFLLGYGVFRFFVEFYREPDAHLGLIGLDWMTMGQLLSIPVIVAGAWLLIRRAPNGSH